MSRCPSAQPACINPKLLSIIFVSDSKLNSQFKKMRRWYSAVLPFTLVLLLLCFAVPSNASLLPLADSLSNLWPDRFPDPFKIVDHDPFGIDRDETADIPPARVDWKETPDGHIIKLDVPGMKKDELKVEIEENRVLRVSGDRKQEEEKKGDHWHRVEIFYGKFWRRFKLPENVDLDSVQAKLDNGVLTLCFSKFAHDKPKDTKVITIASGGDEQPAKIKSSEAKQEL